MKFRKIVLLVLIISISACGQNQTEDSIHNTPTKAETKQEQTVKPSDDFEQISLKEEPSQGIKPAPAKESPNYWYQQGAGKVYQLAKGNPFPKTAKNVILIVGDGMSVATVTAARILEGQNQGKSGEENLMSFEKFPQTALSKTYSMDSQVASSAATMSAMMTGVKTKKYHISVNGNASTSDCKTLLGNESKTLLEMAEESGMSTGVVTTARLTHATPAATYAHAVRRYFEADSDIPEDQRSKECKDIAQQLIDFPYGDGIEVALGGGRRNFLPNSKTDPEYTDKTGEREDGRDLTKEWVEKYEKASMVWNLEQFNQIDPSQTKHLLGLFQPKHMNYEQKRQQDKAGEPSLTQMTQKALDILNHQNKSFFLMVESGRIDHGHHDGNAYNALYETIELSNTVETVIANVDLNETLVIVTADHSHTFTIGGYPYRGNPILGLVKQQKWKDPSTIEYAKDDNGKPYTTLSYANGLGYVEYDKDSKLNQEQVTDPEYLQVATVPRFEETHAGEDVTVYATGAGSYTVHGTIEQNVIFHIMKHALQLEDKNN